MTSLPPSRTRTPRSAIARACGCAVLAAASLTGVTQASAQATWLPDRVRADGTGFRTDSAEIHPSFSAEVGYDNNIFLEQTGPNPSALTRLTAGVFVRPRRVDGDAADRDTPQNSRRLDFRFGLNTSYYHYFAQSVRDNVAGTLDANIRTRPDSRFSFELGQSFNRTIRPFTDATSTGFARMSYGQNRSQTTIGLHSQSTGGVLRGSIAYTADMIFFDSGMFNANNSLEHRVATRLSWAFFPRTAFFYEGTASFLGYGLASSGDPYARLTNSRRIGGQVGVNGILTPKLALTLSAGYAAGFFSAGSEYDGYLARAELRYRPKPGLTFTAGFGHDFQPSYIGNYNDVTSGYLNTEMAFGGRFLVGSQLSFGYSQSGVAKRDDGSFLGNFQTRIDMRMIGRVYSEYRPTSYLAITLSLEYLGDYTNYTFSNPPGVSGILPDPGAAYQRFEAWLGARVYH